MDVHDIGKILDLYNFIGCESSYLSMRKCFPLYCHENWAVPISFISPDEGKGKPSQIIKPFPRTFKFDDSSKRIFEPQKYVFLVNDICLEMRE